MIFLGRSAVTFQLPGQNVQIQILVFAHPIGKLKIVLESLRPREYMVKNPFLDFECFTSGNPCDSSTSPMANFWLETPEKFSRHGFSFFNPNIPLSLKTRTKSKIDCLFHDNPHLNSKNPFLTKLKKNFQGKTQKPNLVCQN